MMTASSPPIRIRLVRHGQSAANAGIATSEDSTIPLTEFGRQQSLRFAEEFPLVPTQFVLSPFLRARQTALPLLQRFPTVPVEEWAIQEFHYLDLDSIALTDQQRQPYVLEYWEQCDPAAVHGPRAESFSGFLQRVRSATRRLGAHSTGGCHVLFTHGFWMQAFRLLLFFPHATDFELMQNFRRFHFANIIRNLESLDFEIIDGQIKPIGQEPLISFTLQ